LIFRNNIHKRKSLSAVESTKALKTLFMDIKLQGLLKTFLLKLLKLSFTQSNRRKLQQNLSCELQAGEAVHISFDAYNTGTNQTKQKQTNKESNPRRKRIFLAQQEQNYTKFMEPVQKALYFVFCWGWGGGGKKSSYLIPVCKKKVKIQNQCLVNCWALTVWEHLLCTNI